MAKTLLVIDMLNDFIRPEGKLYFPGGQAVIEPIARLKAACKAAGIPVLYDNDVHPPGSEEFKTWPEHCLVGSWGAQVVEELAPGPGDIVFHKDALSLFYDGTAEKLLRGLGVTHLLLTGVATEYCVKHCALDALALGFAVTVVSDAVAGVDVKPGDTEQALEAMRLAGATLADTAEVLAGLAA